MKNWCVSDILCELSDDVCLWIETCSDVECHLLNWVILYVLLTVNSSIIFANKPTWRTIFLIYLFLVSISFAQLCAHHQENQLYQWEAWYMSLCVDDSLVCRSDLHTRRSSTQSDIYQASHWYNWFSWWWTLSCPKQVDNRK